MFGIKLVQQGKHWGWLTPSGKVFMLNTCPDSAKFPSEAEAAEGLATSQADPKYIDRFIGQIVPVGKTAEQRLLRLMLDSHRINNNPGAPTWTVVPQQRRHLKPHIATAPYGDGVAGVEYIRAMEAWARARSWRDHVPPRRGRVKPLPGFEDEPYQGRVWQRRIAIAHALQYLTEDEVEAIIKASATARYPGMLWEIAEAPTPNTVNIFKGSVIIRKCGGLLIGTLPTLPGRSE
jgi:hypothetical protein